MQNRIPTIQDWKYYTLEEAYEEWQRREEIRKLIEEFWRQRGWGVPIFPIRDKPFIMWCRAIALATYEVLSLVIMARAHGFGVLFSDLYTDHFALDSGSKKSAVVMHIVCGRGRNGGYKIKKVKLVDGNIQDLLGKPMGGITTTNGLTLPAYHSNRFMQLCGQDELRVDYSEWVKGGNERGAREYYLRYLSWFMGHAVLMDDYHAGQSGTKLINFLNRVVNPAYQELVQRFGVQPMIVRAPWADKFDYYPEIGSDWRSHGIIPDNILKLER